MNQELHNQVKELSKLNDGWAGEGTYAPLPIIIDRVTELINLLDIPETHEVEIDATMHGTIFIDITEGAWKMSIEVGKSGANYYTINANRDYSKYENGDKSMAEFAQEINDNQ